MKKSQRSIINRGILKKKKIFSILSILLLISILLSSCIIKQSYKFTDVIIYSLKGDIHYVDFDGKKDRLLVSKDDVLKLYNKKEEFNELRLHPLCVSSDKHKLFFTKMIVQGSGTERKDYYELFSIDSNRNNIKKLTDEEFEVLKPYYSQDKNYVAFIALNKQKGAIFILQLSDGTFKRVTPWYYNTKSLDSITDIVFSQDSKKIFFVVINKNENSYDLNMIDINNEKIETIVSDVKDITIYEWSYDGKMLAFTIKVSGWEWYDSKQKLCIVENEGSNFKILTEALYQISSVKWSNDSSKILFNHYGKPETWESISKNSFLSVVDIKEADFKETIGYDIIDGYWTSDNSKVVAKIGEDNPSELDIPKYAIYIIDIESMNPIRITPYYPYIDKLIFHPEDKDKVIFTSGPFPYANTNKLEILNLKDKTIKTVEVFDKDQEITDISFSPDSKNYFIRVRRNKFDNSSNIEISVSLFIYNSNTNTTLRKFETDVNEEFGGIKWISNNEIIFNKYSIVSGITAMEEYFQDIYLYRFNVSNGEIFELTFRNVGSFDNLIVASD